MNFIRVKLSNIIVGGPNAPSIIVLTPFSEEETRGQKLPIYIGSPEAYLITAAIHKEKRTRPSTHDLLIQCIDACARDIRAIQIVSAEGEIFHAEIQLIGHDGSLITLDARPSDALALAIRKNLPVFVAAPLLESAALPDFDAVREEIEADKLKGFRDFLDSVNPEDFNQAEN